MALVLGIKITVSAGVGLRVGVPIREPEGGLRSELGVGVKLMLVLGLGFGLASGLERCLQAWRRFKIGVRLGYNVSC